MRIAVIPGALALQERYASLIDPIPELREAVTSAADWADQVFVLNGSARRTQTSPGPFDARAIRFDDTLLAALTTADADAIRAIDHDLAAQLWATTDAAPALAETLAGREWRVTVDHNDAPTGVAWWVVRYEQV